MHVCTLFLNVAEDGHKPVQIQSEKQNEVLTTKTIKKWML